MSMVKTSTSAKVPIMDAGFLGLNGMTVKMVIIRKYTLAALLNWLKSDRGAHVSTVYLVVLTLLDNIFCSSGVSIPN